MELFHKTLKKPSKTTIIISSIVAFLVICILAFFFITYAMMSRPTFYNGIMIGDVAVGGMTKEEAISAVEDFYAEALTADVMLQCNDNEQVIHLPDINATLDAQSIAQTAYSAGREGNYFDRLSAIWAMRKNPVVFAPVISCDEEPIKAALGEITNLVNHSGKEMEVSLTETELVITKGVPGTGINTMKTIETFKNSALTLLDGIFNVTIENIVPKEPVASEIYEQVFSEPVDASYIIENHRLVISEHKNGISFDVNAAQTLINESTGDTITIPIVTTSPEMTTQKLNNSLFPELLGTYSSRYNAGDTARSYNVSLASQKINDVVLAPGDVFSYNEIVGPRTTAHGFRVANVYVGNRIEPGVGGGICQVSSTLFNAVVLADLNIVYRTNHSLPVSYVPLGRDATVSYGSIDFKFSNNTSNPIKIVAYASGGTNKISVYGVKEHPGRTISISTECIGTRPPVVTQKEDPTLPEGTIKVEQAGSSGSTYNTYKITSENGKVIKTEFLTKSTYVPGERIEIIGTGPAEETEPTNGEVPPLDENETPGSIPSEEPTVSEETQPPVAAEPEPVVTPEPTTTPLSELVSNPAA